MKSEAYSKSPSRPKAHPAKPSPNGGADAAAKASPDAHPSRTRTKRAAKPARHADDVVTAPSAPPAGKLPFDIDAMMDRVRDAVADRPKAVLFQLAEEGYGSPFQILVACVITIRTFEEVSLPTARKLFAVASTPAEIAQLTPAKIDELIRACTFHEPKSRTIHAIAKRVTEEFAGELPCDFDALTGFAGVGPKCANLALGIACDQPGGVPVDIHVHRVTNRWGYVAANTPEKTMAALESVLPRKYWVEINKLMVPFGKFVCTGKTPKCSTCPVLAYCRQVGVTSHR